MSLDTLFATALDNRSALFDQLHLEDTNAYRLFHGTNEGLPGVTIDRYGPQVLIQSFHESLDADQIKTIEARIPESFNINQVVYNDRSAKHSRRKDASVVEDDFKIAAEFGLNYKIQGKHSGQDPYLFLDFRAARRKVLQLAEGKTVLNLFAYTCGIGLCAAMAGASEVINNDFAARYLEVGKANLELNGLEITKTHFVKDDFFTYVRQLARMSVNQRGKPLRFPHVAARSFDLVILDPPRWAKSSFGTVDLIRDYQSVLKPSVLATSEGGQLLCTNNVAKVDFEEWKELVLRCAKKAGKPAKSYERILPEADFPSNDENPPLKMLLLQF